MRRLAETVTVLVTACDSTGNLSSCPFALSVLSTAQGSISLAWRRGRVIIVALGDRDGELINGYGLGGAASIDRVDPLGSTRARPDRHDVDLQPAICLD